MFETIKSFLRYIATYVYGKYLFRKRGVRISPSSFLNKKTVLKGKNTIHSNVVISNSQIGFATLIGKNCYLPNTIIGAYCSIAANVKIIEASHPSSKFVSTHPAFYSLLNQTGFTYATVQKFNEHLYYDEQSKVCVYIGNDVWIGLDVVIMGGVKIADGAIIAAGSYVVKDVLPYQIVGGVPAKLIRTRFDDVQIEALLKIKWWNYPQSWIQEHANLFDDIDLFLGYTKK